MRPSYNQYNRVKEVINLYRSDPRSFNDEVIKYSEELKSCYQHNLPMISANPDKVVIRQNGEMIICAGELAKYYSNLGGFVKEFGKPHEEIFI